MKKAISILLAAVLLLSLAACGGNDTPTAQGDTSTPTQEAENKPTQNKVTTTLELDKVNTVADYAEFSLIRITTTPKITGTMGNGMYYENNTSGETYIDIVLDYKNLSANAISSDEVVSAKAIGTKGEYNCGLYCVETDNMSDVSQYESMKPLSTNRLHCAISLPTSETSVKIELSVNGELFSVDYTLDKDIKNTTPLSVGEEIEVVDYAKLSFKGIKYTEDLLPSNTSRSYSHIQIKSTDNIYLVVMFDVMNYQATAKKADTFIGVTAKYMGKYTYTGGVQVEDKDERGFSSYESIDPLATRKFYYLIEVPKTVIENDVELSIMFNSKEYSFKGK